MQTWQFELLFGLQSARWDMKLRVIISGLIRCYLWRLDARKAKFAELSEFFLVFMFC